MLNVKLQISCFIKFFCLKFHLIELALFDNPASRQRKNVLRNVKHSIFIVWWISEIGFQKLRWHQTTQYVYGGAQNAFVDSVYFCKRVLIGCQKGRDITGENTWRRESPRGNIGRKQAAKSTHHSPEADTFPALFFSSFSSLLVERPAASESRVSATSSMPEPYIFYYFPLLPLFSAQPTRHPYIFHILLLSSNLLLVTTPSYSRSFAVERL